MTVLLVLFTIIIFIAADNVVQRVRRARAARALEPLRAGTFAQLPEGIALAFNHTWMREERKGLTTIGIDAFLSAATGAVESIILPPRESCVVPTTPNVTLRHHGRELLLALPVQGEVVEVNQAVLQNPALASSDPYGSGWLLKVRPFNRPGPRLATVVRQEAAGWMREQMDRAKEFFVMRLPQPVLMQDGGVPANGLLKEFSPEVWKEFQATFLINQIEQ
jgi:glycine cleavage system H protein